MAESDVGDDVPEVGEFQFQTVGEQLKAEREKQGLSLTEIATRTRIPMRHLESIEKSEYSALPGTTYSLGFTRSYARTLNMNVDKLNTELRSELAENGLESYSAPTPNYQPADPARVPSKILAWTAAAVGILLLAAYLIWRDYQLETQTEPIPVTQEVAKTPDVAKSPAPQITPASPDEVILTATGAVWVKIYDADNRPLYENEMQSGDQYHVPPEANNPMIVTGLPQLLKVVINGQEVAPLGNIGTIVDVGVSAASLRARQDNQNVAAQPTAQPVTPQIKKQPADNIQ